MTRIMKMNPSMFAKAQLNGYEFCPNCRKIMDVDQLIYITKTAHGGRVKYRHNECVKFID